ncbi:MAG TPA: hypothetical protein VLL08_23110 [Kineosporiaceae bacterium]|nr:hypothetical protein [Kineosporiaceae bacterium]
MTESDERLESLAKTIDEGKAAAKALSEKDLIDPDAVEGEAPGSVDEATGRADEADADEDQDRGPTPEP